MTWEGAKIVRVACKLMSVCVRNPDPVVLNVKGAAARKRRRLLTYNSTWRVCTVKRLSVSLHVCCLVFSGLLSHHKYLCSDAWGHFNNFKSGLICLHGLMWEGEVDWVLLKMGHLSQRCGFVLIPQLALSFRHLLFCLKEELEKRLALEASLPEGEIQPSSCSRARVNVCFCWRSLWCVHTHMLTFMPVFVIVRGKFLGCLVSETYSDQMKRTEFPWFCLEFLWE